MPKWMIDAIIKLWGEAHNVRYICAKPGIIDEITGEYDYDKVIDVIKDPSNYPTKREYYKEVVVQQL